MSEPSIRVGSTPEDVRLDADDLLAPPRPDETRGVSPLEGLRKVLAEPAQKKPITLKVPSRPGVTVEFRTNVSQDERKAWQKRSTKKRRGADDEVDEMLFALLVVANTCQAILFNGTAAHDETDQPLTFAHRQLWDMVGGTDPQTTIRAFYGVDPHILLTSGTILLESGFDDDVEADTPTSSS